MVAGSGMNTKKRANRLDRHRDGRGGRDRNPAPERPRIYGLHAVAAWLDARPDRLQAVFCEPNAADAVRALAAKARAAGVPVHTLSADEIAERAAAKRNQGIFAECEAFPYVELEELLGRRPNLIVVIDQIQDPHNLGAILRSAEAVGAGGLVSPKDHCVGVTAVAEAASAGASAWLPVARVTNLARALTQLKDAGYWIAGLHAGGTRDLFAFDPPEHVALLVGGESGIRPLVARQIDFELAIPMYGHTESLNASVAAAVGMFVLRHRRAAARGGEPN